MVSRRKFIQVASSDDEEDFVAETRSQGQNSRRPEDDETPPEGVKPDDVKPVGEPVKVTSRGRWKRTHYGQFEYKGDRYKLEDTVLLRSEDNTQKPYIAIIKDITQKQDGRMMILGHWFYRPEEAKKKDGGNWEVNDPRELFYSFHRNEFPVESVMHKCVVNFVPDHKQLPKRRDNPGFIVQKVYDTVEKKLWNFTDKVYDDAKQHEIDLFVEKSVARLGDLPDLEPKLYHFI
ncbi:bromo-adjacent homology (BAH) domain-containing protein [Raphanus sativus]|uniref:Uncharacterized protein LOC108824844 n=1 Tax=Raphanus sativus TaxID=3726 RepID=A0A6J0L1I8_RAPSA|nr:uncharacterized protein LOC108824844 [Raphanus sativus]KAJ4876295.1 bromo-adjacent homology (BAH) domain-containing protein [Raphanus sativus]